MIIKIDSSIVAGAEEQNIHCLTFISDVLSARRRGNILVDISKRDALRLLDIHQDQVNKYILNVIKEEVSFHKEIVKEFGVKKTFVFIEQPDVLPEPRHYNINGYCGENPILLNYLESPKLVLENINDDLVYSKILQWHRLLNNFPSDLDIKYKVVHGGGNTTSAVCQENISAGYLTYALCDSDKKSPHCPLGQTAKDTKETFEAQNLLTNFHVIDVHEVENLLPIDILYSTARQEQLPAINFIKSAVLIDPSAYSYYDFKKAITYHFVNNNESSGNYWKNILLNIEGLDLQRTDTAKIVNGLSSMLPHAIQNLASADLTKKNIEPLSLVAIWTDIANIITAWFITRKPISIS